MHRAVARRHLHPRPIGSIGPSDPGDPAVQPQLRALGAGRGLDQRRNGARAVGGRRRRADRRHGARGRSPASTCDPAHFAERHGLIVILALGESVVDLGVGAEGRLHDAATVITALLGAVPRGGAVVALLRPRRRGGRAVPRPDRPGRPETRRRCFAYSLGVLVLVTGVILAAAGSGDGGRTPARSSAALARVEHRRRHRDVPAGSRACSAACSTLPAAWIRPAAADPRARRRRPWAWPSTGRPRSPAITAVLVLAIVLDARRTPVTAGDPRTETGLDHRARMEHGGRSGSTHMGFTADLYAEPRPPHERRDHAQPPPHQRPAVQRGAPDMTLELQERARVRAEQPREILHVTRSFFAEPTLSQQLAHPGPGAGGPAGRGPGPALTAPTWSGRARPSRRT